MSNDGQKKKKARRTSGSETASEQTREISYNPGIPSSAKDLYHMSPPIGTPHLQERAPPKVAIPRLHADSDMKSVRGSSSQLNDKNRVTQACEPCRHRKTKCSAERPRCKHCENSNLACVYVNGKRDRAKRQFDAMSERLHEYENLLIKCNQTSDEPTKARIARALEKDDSPNLTINAPPSPDIQSLSENRSREFADSRYGENRSTGRAGSTDAMDNIDEDYNRSESVRATGYHGKNSEITWMQRLRKQTESSHESEKDDDETTFTYQDQNPVALSPISSSTYHCDDLSVFIDPEKVDRFSVPTPLIADALFESYLEVVHPVFPVIGRRTFSSQYRKFSDQGNIVGNNSWLAILNLIFAIGAVYNERINVEWIRSAENHLIYFTRARLLGFNSESMLGHADLQLVQICGLTSFYLMTVNQINRSWTISGIAIRHAQTLGLNLRNESTDVDEFAKEIRYRVWWALCFLERQLAVMTGRPTSFSEANISAPLPLPLDEKDIGSTANHDLVRRHFLQHSRPPGPSLSLRSHNKDTVSDNPSPLNSSEKHLQQLASMPANNGLYFFCHTQLSNITYEVLNHLYCTASINKTWAETQATMSYLDAKLEQWRQNLPVAFDFTKNKRDFQWARQRRSLGFFYYSSMLLINRPCLCRIDRKIANQSTKALEFNQASAAKCVHAACDMLELLPDVPNPVGMYSQSPWWCLVHHLVEAVVVCMLELSFRSDHMPNEIDDIFDSAEKAVSWLRSMGKGDLAAKRAWCKCEDMLRKIAPKVGKIASTVQIHQAGQHTTSEQHMLQARSAHDNQLAYNFTVPLPLPMLTPYDQLTYGQMLQMQPPGAGLEAGSQTYGAALFPTARDIDEAGLGSGQIAPEESFFPSQDQWPG